MYSCRSRSKFSLRAVLALTTVLSGALCFAVSAQADDTAPTQTAAASPASWGNTLKFYGHAEGGVAFNAASPDNNENFGSLFTDKANQPQLNQLMLTAERPIDSSSSNFDIGFKLQGLFGTDARYSHSLAETDHLIHSKYQFDFNEATVNMHLPVAFEGGVDLKVGQFPSPMSAETIDATTNSLYSHSYIFNFGVPMKSTGVLATAHVNSTLDIYGGFDTGVNGGITADGDNNKNIKGQFGFGLNNLLGGDLSLVALSHVGTEDPSNVTPQGAMRYLNDVTATYKANDKLTLTTDVNYIEEDSVGAIGYGVAQYATYALNDNVTLVGRAEIWRDNSGVFVAAYPGYFDAANAQRGLTNTSYTAPRTTYSELTLGVNYKPEVPKAVEGLVIRPELRVDHSLNGTKPFNAGDNNIGTDGTSFTPAVDVVVPF
ncbi:MAG: outer membrane beta-barrel protein [Alphaproteobacteria bacterium]|nr:outer membrane beta-barrel protein [Alphaproteobacteria bacterium]